MGKYPGPNYLFNFWWRSVKVFGHGKGSNFQFSHWLASSTLQHSHITVRVCCKALYTAKICQGRKCASSRQFLISLHWFDRLHIMCIPSSQVSLVYETTFYPAWIRLICCSWSCSRDVYFSSSRSTASRSVALTVHYGGIILIILLANCSLTLLVEWHEGHPACRKTPTTSSQKFFGKPSGHPD